MKWDSENKERLYAVLRQKSFKTEGHVRYSGWPGAQPFKDFRKKWREFIFAYGIREVQKKNGFWWESVWIQNAAKEWHDSGCRASKPNRIIVQDPIFEDWDKKRFAKSTKKGLSIPKEIAEKFLILGVP